MAALTKLDSLSAFAGPLTAATHRDPRQPLLSHFFRAFGDVLSEDDARTLLDALSQARHDPEQVKDILNNALGGSLQAGADDVGGLLGSLVTTLLHNWGSADSVAWLPLEALIKVNQQGLVVGFKGPPVLTDNFEAWKSYKRALDPEIKLSDLTPEDFIYETRVGIAVAYDSNGKAIGFPNHPKAQKGYDGYVLARLKKTDPSRTRSSITDADRALYPADDYLNAMTPTLGPAASLDALFGPNPSRAAARRLINRAPSSDKTDWGKVFPRTYPGPEDNWKQNIIDIIKDRTVFAQRIHDAFNVRFPGGVVLDDAQRVLWEDEITHWVYQMVMHHIDTAGGNLSHELGDKVFYNHFVRDALASGKGDEILKLLLGSKNMKEGLHSGEFIERILDSYIVFGAKAVDMGIPWGHASYARIGGMWELIQKGMSRSGTVRGYQFELEVVFSAIKDELSLSRPKPKYADIILQFDIGGAQGPDVLVLTDKLVKVLQAKAYKSMSQLYDFNGEVARQTGSDLRRLMDAFKDPDLDGLANTTGDIDWPNIPFGKDEDDNDIIRQLSNVWTFYVDGRRTPGGLSSAAKTKCADTVTTINDALKSSELASLGDSSNVKQILDRSKEKLVKNGTETIGDFITDVVNTETPKLTVQQVAILRMMMKENMGAITPDVRDTLLKRARVYSRLKPPLEIKIEVRTQQNLNEASFDDPAKGLGTVEN